MSFLEPVNPPWSETERESAPNTRSNLSGELKQRMTRSGSNSGRKPRAERHSLSESSASAFSDATSIDRVGGRKCSGRASLALPQYYRGNHGEVSGVGSPVGSIMK